MRFPHLAAALALSAALCTAGCEKCFHREAACGPTAAAAPPCGCNGPVPAGPYAPAPLVTTPPPGAIIQR